jgi:hypothetical protein
MLYPLRWTPTETPKVISAEEMILVEAYKRIGWTDQPNYDIYGGDARVWLFLFEGEWQLTFPVPGPVVATTAPPGPPSHGCAFRIFSAINGDPIAGGFTPC